jgi:hypothetical protein
VVAVVAAAAVAVAPLQNKRMAAAVPAAVVAARAERGARSAKATGNLDAPGAIMPYPRP